MLLRFVLHHLSFPPRAIESELSGEQLYIVFCGRIHVLRGSYLRRRIRPRSFRPHLNGAPMPFDYVPNVGHGNTLVVLMLAYPLNRIPGAAHQELKRKTQTYPKTMRRLIQRRRGAPIEVKAVMLEEKLEVEVAV